jgi:DNA-binding CsgD family transcriptional regulator/predicted negative regulator of RcsB-dependent stress response
LGEAVQATVARRGGVLFVVGEAGIGKSRLLQTVADDAEARGMTMLRGRAVQAMSPVAYRPIAEALSALARTGGLPDTPELSPYRRVLGRLVPEWRADAMSDDSVVAIAEAVLRFLRAVAANRGCVAVLEDLHWADPETLAVVEYLADHLTTEPVLCIVTLRNDSASPALDLARAASARRVSDVIDLSRLTKDDVAALVGSCLDIADVPLALLDFAERADGVPFLVEELLAAAVASGRLIDSGSSWTLSDLVEPVVPANFAENMRRRLDLLDAASRSVLSAAAILGRRFAGDLLGEITGLDEGSINEALHAGIDAQILSIDGGAFRFRHALSRDAVLAQLLPSERASWSRRALDAIEVRTPLDVEHCELAAELARAAGDRRRAAALLLDVARDAAERGALASAEATLERALTWAPAADALVADIEECLVDVLSMAGKRDRAVEVADSLLHRLGTGATLAARRGEVGLRLARVSVAAARWEDARAHLSHARTEATRAKDERLIARADSLEALAVLGQDDQDLAVALAQTALVAAERLDLPEVSCEALEVLGRCERWRNLAAAEGAFTRAYAIAEQHGLLLWRIRALHELGTIDLLEAGDTDRLEEARGLALECGALATVADLDVQICAALLDRDDPEPALLVARRAVDLARRLGLTATLPIAIGFEATAHARAARRPAMEDCLAQARSLAPDSADMTIIEVGARVFFAFAEDEPSEALRHLDESNDTRYSAPFAGMWALLRATRVDPDDVTDEIHSRGEPVHYFGRAYLRYAEAVVLGRAGHRDQANRAVEAGDTVLERLDWFRHYGHRLMAEAALVDGWGDPVSWLREAQGFFHSSGHDRHSSTCRSLLRTAGVPVPRRGRGASAVPSHLQALGVTSREVDVLVLVAAGLSNREIAERLVLSLRTVESHVEHLLAKTATANRRELGRVAGGAGDSDPPR